MSAKNSHEEIVKFLSENTVVDDFEYIDQNDAKSAIYHLPSTLWPRTPLGYRWKLENNKLHCVRDRETTPVNHTVKVYGPNNNGRVNYITSFNGVNVQSFCFTRAKNETYCQGGAGKTKQANRYPSDLNPADFTANGVQYIRGHCIDYKDTIETTPLSSNDPINFLPEVPNRIYWDYFRNHWINEIRKHQNAYMQIPYYNDHSNFFVPSDSTNLVTTYGTYVPKGVFLTEIDVNSIQLFSSQLDISWVFPFTQHINNSSGTYKKCAKQVFHIGTNSLPVPLIDFTHGTVAHMPQAASHEKIPEILSSSRSSRFETDHLHRKAESEIQTSRYKLMFAYRLSKLCNDKTNAESYLKRAKKHATFLESLDDKRAIIKKEDVEKVKELHKQQSLGFEDTDDLDFWSTLIKQ